MNRKIKGYSLIELIIIVAVIALLFMIGISNYNRFNQRQMIKSAAEDFATNLRLIQKQVDAGNKGACTSATYSYSVERQGNGYEFNVLCPDHTGGNLITISSYSFSNGVSLVDHSLKFSQDKHIEFLSLSNGVAVAQDVVLALHSCRITVSISIGGVIIVGNVTGC